MNFLARIMMILADHLRTGAQNHKFPNWNTDGFDLSFLCRCSESLVSQLEYRRFWLIILQYMLKSLLKCCQPCISQLEYRCFCVGCFPRVFSFCDRLNKSFTMLSFPQGKVLVSGQVRSLNSACRTCGCSCESPCFVVFLATKNMNSANRAIQRLENIYITSAFQSSPIDFLLILRKLPEARSSCAKMIAF